MSENFFHSCAFKNTAVICLFSNEFVPKLLVKADRFDAAVDDYLLVTAFLNPLFSFAHGHGTELFSAVFQQNNHAADGCRACFYFVEAAGRDRIFVIQQDYVLGGVAVVLVELLAEPKCGAAGSCPGCARSTRPHVAILLLPGEL